MSKLARGALFGGPHDGAVISLRLPPPESLRMAPRQEVVREVMDDTTLSGRLRHQRMLANTSHYRLLGRVTDVADAELHALPTYMYEYVSTDRQAPETPDTPRGGPVT